MDKNKQKFECEQCHTCFSREDNKKAHVREIHSTDRPIFVCSLCENSEEYKFKRNIKVHLRKVHFGGINRQLTKELNEQIDSKIAIKQTKQILNTGNFNRCYNTLSNSSILLGFFT